MSRTIVAAVAAWLLPGAAAQPHTSTAKDAPCLTVRECRDDLARARDAIDWQKRARRALARHVRAVQRPGVIEAAQLAGAAFGVDPWQMVRVSACETGGTFDPFAVNSSSGAAGPWQYLASTWANTPFARWSRTDPVASALATAQIVRAQGWRQWSCRP